MGWMGALAWSAVGLLMICGAIIAYGPLRDRSLRGRRVSNGEVQRERVTIMIPADWLQLFKDR